MYAVAEISVRLEDAYLRAHDVLHRGNGLPRQLRSPQTTRRSKPSSNHASLRRFRDPDLAVQH